MKLKTAKQIQEYIKKEFGVEIKIEIKNHFWGGFWGWYSGSENKIKLSKQLFEKQEYLTCLIWHEIGHHFTIKPNASSGACIKNEVNAQIWAIREAKKRNYTRIYQWLVDYVISGSGWKERDYRRARRIIIDKLKNNRLTLMK